MIPLLIDRAGSAPQVGLVMAAVSSGMLTAPLWGALADRYGRHHGMFLTGIALAERGARRLPATQRPARVAPVRVPSWSRGFSYGNRRGPFCRRVSSESGMAKRLGNLQMFYGGGQVAGLVLAGLVHTDPQQRSPACRAPERGSNRVRAPRPQIDTLRREHIQCLPLLFTAPLLTTPLLTT